MQLQAMPEEETDVAREMAGQCVAYRTRRLGRIVTRIYDEALRPFDLRATQLNLLVAITLLDGPVARELGHELELEKSTPSRNLAVLAERGRSIEGNPNRVSSALHR